MDLRTRFEEPALPQLPRPKAISIGWVEHATLFFQETHVASPRLKLKAKVDTGANTSSLHAVDIEPFEYEGATHLRFVVPLNGVFHRVQAPVARRGVVRSSEGLKDERYFIEAVIRMGRVMSPIVLSLNDRSSMLYPVLLGRSFLRERYVVDVSRKFLLNKPTWPLP